MSSDLLLCDFIILPLHSFHSQVQAEHVHLVRTIAALVMQDAGYIVIHSKSNQFTYPSKLLNNRLVECSMNMS